MSLSSNTRSAISTGIGTACGIVGVICSKGNKKLRAAAVLVTLGVAAQTVFYTIKAIREAKADADMKDVSQEGLDKLLKDTQRQVGQLNDTNKATEENVQELTEMVDNIVSSAQ